MENAKIRRLPPLHRAAFQNDVALLEKFLVDFPTDLEQVFENFRPLDRACQAGSLEAARLLLEAGASAEEHSDGRVFYEICWAPIHLATFSGNVALVELLLSYGVSPIASDLYSSVPLHHARTAEMASFLVPLTKQYSRWGLEETDVEGRTPVHDIALRGDDEALRVLLENGADASYHDGEAGRFPLHRAAPRYWRRCCELLLDFGADINATDMYDRTVLDETLASSVFYPNESGLSRAEFVGWLVERGAKSNRFSFHEVIEAVSRE